jgi:hypothetical protein
MEDIRQNSMETLLRYPERGIRKMFPTVAETLGEVCSCRRKLCWRQLWLKPHKLYLLHVLWSVRILFKQTSYTTNYLLYIVVWLHPTRLLSAGYHQGCGTILKKTILL